MFSQISQVLNGKNIVILGFGREGKSTLDFIRRYMSPSSVTIADLNDVGQIDGCKTICGSDYQKGLDRFDIIIKSPGVVYDAPTAEIVAKTTSQTTLFLSEFKERTIGITGTKGKSTTTSLIYHILKENDIPTVLAGNIGIPPLSVAEEMLDRKATAVLEMSCHQLEYEKYAPHISIILNLFEDHLDHYKTREKYVDAKRSIYRNQSSDDIFICNADCERELSEAPSKTVSVGANADVDVLDDSFVFDGKKMIVSSNETALVGKHNVFNIASAYCATSLFGINETDFFKALKTFKPLAHRLEYVKTINGVDYYDDSISTVCQTTIQAISSLDNVATVIIGGMDRGIDYSELVAFLKNNPVKNVILLPDSGYRIAKMLEGEDVHCILAKDLENAVEIAVKVGENGTKCVLSPAAASYGFFKNFEHRGQMFQKYLDKY
jgi:UDP-N-acetylmuramoylalanine--D-glutamate ligase